MASKPSIRIVRPYDSVEDFLVGDAWTVDRADMLLVGAEPHDPNATVRFEIVLASGASVVTGEGRVLSHVPARGERPAGLRVRFQKLDEASKTTLKRALETQKRSRVAKPVASAAAEPRDAESSPSNEAALSPQQALSSEGDDAAPSAKSGVRNALVPAAAPKNRNALLDRLRERAKTVEIDVLLASKRSTAAE